MAALPPTLHQPRTLVCAATLYLLAIASSRGEDVFETRYQYYQEDDDRIRVDSDYSLFSIDLGDTVLLDGSLLYSAISGASPIGIPAFPGESEVPTAYLEDQRYAMTLNLTQQLGIHSLKTGVSYSYEADYLSVGGSITDTISLNEKNTELVLGLAYSRDSVGAAGSQLDETKQIYDFILGVNQVLSPRTLLTANLLLGKKTGYLSDAYKRVLIDDVVYREERPDEKFEQIGLLQLTHDLESWNASVEASYRFGHNDFGINSHTAMIAIYKYLFNKRVVLRPSFRFYSQNEADFYATQFTGDPDHFSSDYRVSAEQTFNYGLQLRWNIRPDKLAMDLGYERYISKGTDGVTSQSAYPDANSLTLGFRWQF
jgi:Protein of unknown function (DUF3570)